MLVEGQSASEYLRQLIYAGRRLQAHELMADADSAIWQDFGPSTTPYDLTFGAFLQQHGVTTFAAYLTQLKQVKPLYALDLAAPLGSFIAHYPQLDGGIAVTLTDTRSVEQRQQDEQHRRFLVEGNLFQRRTWIQLRQTMARAQIPTFDLILARPFAGMMEVADPALYASLCHSLLGRAYQWLNPQGGVLMTELPDLQSSSAQSQFEEYQAKLALLYGAVYHTPDRDGSKAYEKRTLMQIIKTPQLPVKMFPLKELLN